MVPIADRFRDSFIKWLSCMAEFTNADTLPELHNSFGQILSRIYGRSVFDKDCLPLIENLVYLARTRPEIGYNAPFTFNGKLGSMFSSVTRYPNRLMGDFFKQDVTTR